MRNHSSFLSFPSLPSPWQPPNLLSVSVNLPILDISYNRIVHYVIFYFKLCPTTDLLSSVMYQDLAQRWR